MNRIVILARSLGQGGAERQIVALAKALKERGRDIHLVLFYSGGVFDDDLAAAGVPIHFVEKRGRWDVVRFLFHLLGILRSLRASVIYSFLGMPNILSVLLSPLMGSPRLIWSVRAAGMEMRHYDWLSRLVYGIEAGLSRIPAAIVANSQAGATWAASRGFPAGRIIVIENGIDTDRFRFDTEARQRLRAAWGIEDDILVIGLAARLDPMKGHEAFIEAAAELVKRLPDVRFVCVGEGPADYLTRLMACATSFGIADRMVWAGARHDMPAVYSAFDIASSSSSFGEGFSNAIAEAMACERLCVVTDVGDSARIVGCTGWVVPPRHPHALAEAWLSAAGLEPTERQARGRAARERIEAEFSVARMVSRTERILFERR